MHNLLNKNPYKSVHVYIFIYIFFCAIVDGGKTQFLYVIIERVGQ